MGTTQFKRQFIARTKLAREGTGKSQAEMAVELGIGGKDPQGTYKQYEVRSYLPHHLIPRFCQLTGVSLEYLFGLNRSVPKHQRAAPNGGKSRIIARP
jgi:transcriptional regulator with XRE-family HTH domain